MSGVSGGNNSTTVDGSLNNSKIDIEINKMIQEKENNPETESEKYMRMTTKNGHKMNVEFI